MDIDLTTINYANELEAVIGRQRIVTDCFNQLNELKQQILCNELDWDEVKPQMNSILAVADIAKASGSLYDAISNAIDDVPADDRYLASEVIKTTNSNVAIFREIETLVIQLPKLSDDMFVATPIKKAGRPKGTKKPNGRNVPQKIRWTEEEWQIVTKAADDSFAEISSYIRIAALDKAANQQAQSPSSKFTEALHAAGWKCNNGSNTWSKGSIVGVDFEQAVCYAIRFGTSDMPIAGDRITVTDGPFLNLPGTVEEVDFVKGRLCVQVEICGRITPVMLEIGQCRVNGE